MQYLKAALPLAAMVSGALANPAWGGKGDSCQNNACLAAVTGKAALGDSAIRASHCSSYLATTVTPIVTETVTITGHGNDNWKRATVALCPNEVPNYASACDDAAYTSACSCFGYTEVKTTTIAPTTTTKTIWVKPTWGAGSCSASTVSITATTTVVSGSTCPAPSTTTSTKVIVTGTTVTKEGGASTSTVTETSTKYVHTGSVTGTTVTVTVATATPTTVTVATATPTTVTVTQEAPSSSASGPASSCVVDDALATQLVTNFVDLLQFTSYAGDPSKHIPAGHGYHQAVSDATLATDFIDISDSINFMAGFPLGGITFNSQAQFDYGQGVLQPEVQVEVLNIWHGCSSITWRWRIFSLPYPVTGINHMLINTDGKVQRNYAEFDSGAWLQSAGQNCSLNAIPAPITPAVTKRGLLEM